MRLESRYLYVAVHGLGDLIMSLPALKLLSGYSRQVDVLVKSSVEAEFLVQIEGFCRDNVIILKDYSRHGLKGYFGLTRLLRKRNYRAAVSQYGVNRKLFVLMSCSSFIFDFFPSPKEGDWGGHKVQKNIRIVSKLTKSGDDLDFWYEVKNKRLTGECGGTVILAPGSGEVEAHKRWPAGKYAELSVKLKEKYPLLDILVVGGPDESRLCNEISRLSGGVCKAVNDLSISDMYALIKSASVMVANCNGLSHVASHAGIPVVGIYGPTNFKVTGPRQHGLIAVSQELPCSPCYGRGNIVGCGNPVCMEQVHVSRVYNAVERLLRD